MSESDPFNTALVTKEPTVNNIKIHLRVHKSSIPILKKSIETLREQSGDLLGKNRKKLFNKHHNFVVFRNSYVFIIFYTKGAVNITGIKDFIYISEAVENFCATFCIPSTQITEYVIDNVSANGDFGKTVDLRSLKHHINKQEDRSNLINSVSFNTNYFPAAFCKTFSIGTILVFCSGKYNIVGAKCREDVQKIFETVVVYINEL